MSVSLIAASAQVTTGPVAVIGVAGLRPTDAACFASAAFAAPTSTMAPRGPRLPGEVEETPGVVVDDVELALAGANVEVAVNPDSKWWAPDLRPRGARHEVEHTVVVAAPS